MKKLLFMLFGLLGMTTAVSAGNDYYRKVEICNIKMEVAAPELESLNIAAWKYVFKLNNPYNEVSDCCDVGVFKGRFYISSPDQTQMFLVDAKGIEPLKSSPEYSFDYGNLWAEPGESLAFAQVKYIYGYSDSDVYVIVCGK